MRSLATARAASTPPVESMRSFYNTTGNVNTANGVDALFNNTTGDANTASGVQCAF